MPSWNIHLATATYLASKIEKKDQNQFIFANILPDILEGYYGIMPSCKVKKYSTHFSQDEIFHGISFRVPGIKNFEKKYRKKLENPIILGYYAHLLTDYYWNATTYLNFYQQVEEDNNLIEVTRKDKMKSRMTYQQATKLKQKDFRIFGNVLMRQKEIQFPFYEEEILKNAEKIKEFSYQKEDIMQALIWIKEHAKEDGAGERDYELFEEEIMKQEFEKSNEFVWNCIKKQRKK